MRAQGQVFLFIAWLIALVGTLSSLYFSEIMHLPVCELCWYQRIMMYPLVLLIGMAAYRSENTVVPYMIPFTVVGFLLALYQYLEQMIPGFAPIEFCTRGTPCSAIHFQWLGFITLPFLSCIAFLVIAVLLLLSNRQ